MPCRDYETDSWGSNYRETEKYKERADMLARIACKAMTALEQMGKEDFLLLKDAEVREWWAAHKEADRREQARLAEIERRERVKAEALARLSDEEKELLGLKTPTAKKHSKKSSTPVPTKWSVDVEDDLLEELSELIKQSRGV